MDNMEIYNKVRAVPNEALKTIAAGRLKGMSDINPMWRIKILTEMFGMCGIGWKYEITRQWTETGKENEIRAFCNINLYVKVGDTWSEAIPGTGGSSYVTVEKNGVYVSDEAYKMSLTDALSVACKSLGVGADVYFANDKTKYSVAQDAPKEYKCAVCGKEFEGFATRDGKHYSAAQVYHMAQSANTDNVARCKDCSTKSGTRKEKANG